VSQEPQICGWCQAPAVDLIVTKPGRKHRITAPVCADHRRRFEAQGLETLGTIEELEERKIETARKRRQYKEMHKPWR
jgi:hypothetical protein